MKFPIWASLFTLIGVIILLGLGTWQVQRLNWKNDIIAKLDAAYDAEDGQKLDFSTASNSDFSYGEVMGHFEDDKTIALGPKTMNGKVGYDVLVPLILSGERSLIINLGWTNQPLESVPVKQAAGKGLVKISGLTRKPDWNSFTSENAPEKDLWFRADIDEIAEHHDLPTPYPFILYAEKANKPVVMEQVRWYPRNKHFQYAVFWYVMAAALVVVFSLRFFGKNKT